MASTEKALRSVVNEPGGRVDVVADKGLLIPFHPSSSATTLIKCPLVGTETDKPDAFSGLIHGFNLSTTPGITESVLDNQPFDMELSGERPLKNK